MPGARPHWRSRAAACALRKRTASAQAPTRPVTRVHPDPSLHRSKLRELHKAARETEDPELQV